MRGYLTDPSCRADTEHIILGRRRDNLAQLLITAYGVQDGITPLTTQLEGIDGQCFHSTIARQCNEQGLALVQTGDFGNRRSQTYGGIDNGTTLVTKLTNEL